MKITSLLMAVLLVSGCATVDKALTPVDKALNATEKTYQSASHSVGETFNDIGNSAEKLKSGFYESSLVKFFVSDETVSQSREKNYVVWNGSSMYDANRIIKEEIKESGIEDPAALKTSDKMKILKEYFFKMLKKQHAKEFSSKHKKPEFNEFLTDRENIEKIHQYKLGLAEAEHQWRIKSEENQKKVAQLMLSTLYSAPVLKYVSYNPYDEEMFLSVASKNKEFMEKIKFDVEKDMAQKMKTNISKIKPYVFFKFNQDVLEFVGVNIKYENKPYVCEVVDSVYARQSDVVFTSDDISLQSLDVQYYNVVKNVKPPEWFNNIKSDGNQVIGFGEGISKDDAKKEAYRDIAMSIKTTVSANFESEKSVVGSTYTNKFKSSSKQKVEEVSIKGSKVLKIEKKDGLWFVAILHDS